MRRTQFRSPPYLRMPPATSSRVRTTSMGKQLLITPRRRRRRESALSTSRPPGESATATPLYASNAAKFMALYGQTRRRFGGVSRQNPRPRRPTPCGAAPGYRPVQLVLNLTRSMGASGVRTITVLSTPDEPARSSGTLHARPRRFIARRTRNVATTLARARDAPWWATTSGTPNGRRRAPSRPTARPCWFLRSDRPRSSRPVPWTSRRRAQPAFARPTACARPRARPPPSRKRRGHPSPVRYPRDRTTGARGPQTPTDMAPRAQPPQTARLASPPSRALFVAQCAASPPSASKTTIAD